MKKTIVLGLISLGLCANCFAYENMAAGYSIKEGAPMLVFENSNTFAYSNYTSKSFDSFKSEKNLQTHTLIRYLSKKDMSEAVGKGFSTNFFNKELEKLALDKGINSPEKITKLADGKIYLNNNKELQKLVYGSNFNYAKILEDNTTVCVKQVGKGRALEFSNYFVNDSSAIAIKTTVLSANDQVYAVMTLGYVPEFEQMLVDKVENNKDESKKSTSIMAISEKDFGSDKVKQLKSDHDKTLKAFKTFVPKEKKHIFGYTDTVTKKFIELPNDWFYVTGNYKEEMGIGSFTFAGNMEELIKGFKEVEDYRTLNAKENAAENLREKNYEECMKIFLKNVNGVKASLSLTLADDDLKEMFGQPLQTKLFVDQIIREGFKRAETLSGPNFKVNDYNYNTYFTESTGKVDIETLITLYKAYMYRADFKGEFLATKNTGNMKLDFSKIKTQNTSGKDMNKEVSNLTLKNAQIK